MSKRYIGDSVYVDFNGISLILTTEQGDGVASNAIVLEPEVYRQLVNYVEGLNDDQGAEVAAEGASGSGIQDA